MSSVATDLASPIGQLREEKHGQASAQSAAHFAERGRTATVDRYISNRLDATCAATEHSNHARSGELVHLGLSRSDGNVEVPIAVHLRPTPATALAKLVVRTFALPSAKRWSITSDDSPTQFFL